VVELTAFDTTGDIGGSVTLDWALYTAPSDIGFYKIFREQAPVTDTGGLTPIEPALIPSTIFVDSAGVSNYTDYYYGIVAVDTSFNESEVACIGPIQARDNIAPGLNSVGIEPSTINETTLNAYLGFTSSETGEYIVSVNGVKKFSGTCLASTSNNDVVLNQTDPDLYEGTNYITVTAFDQAGNSTTSSQTALTVDRRPKALRGVYVEELGATTNRVHWLASPDTDVTNYYVYAQNNLQPGYEQIASVSSGSQMLYTHDGTNPSASIFDYKVVAIDQAEHMSYDAVATLNKETYPPQIIIGAVTVNPNADDNSIDRWGTLTVNWTVETFVEDFIVEVGGGTGPYSGVVIDDGVGKGLWPFDPVTTRLIPDQLNSTDLGQLSPGYNPVFIYVRENSSSPWVSASTYFYFVPGIHGGYVTPTSGYPIGTLFTFYVKYYDPAGSQPAAKTVKFFNEGYSSGFMGMSYLGNGLYELPLAGLPVGTYSHVYSFADQAGVEYILDAAGPTVAKTPTTISASVTSSPPAYFGNKVRIEGSITPIPSGDGPVYVQINLTDPYSSPHTEEALVDDYDGTFRLDYSPASVSGQWGVSVSWAGNEFYGSDTITPFNFDLDPVNSLIECEVSPSSVQTGGTVDIAGRFIPLPNVGHDLSDIMIKLYVTDPDSVNMPVVTATTDTFGAFIFEDYSGLDTTGRWQVFATYSSEVKYNATVSPAVSFDVGTAGYAILIQGKAQGGEGLAEHNKTLNTVYDTLITNRGFTADDIKYLNYSTGQSWVDDVPSEATISYAISNWAADKMNATPAPLYIFMVGHGDGEPSPMFKIYQGTGGPSDDSNNADPAELDGWIDTLETALTGGAANESIYVFYGACYSGSYLALLSETGKKRVIVTSTEADELSGRQPSYGDPRDGEWFINRFINRTAALYSRASSSGRTRSRSRTPTSTRS
jgi:hypothetical protein